MEAGGVSGPGSATALGHMSSQCSSSKAGGEEKVEKKGEKEESLTSACSVCGSPAAAHLHYGAVSCYSCRAFFRRGQPKQIRSIE